MKVTFPKFNPIVFSQGGTEDAAEYEYSVHYTPHLPSTGKLLFQCVIDRTPYKSIVTSTIQLYINNRAFFQLNFTNSNAGSYPYYTINKVGDNRYVFTCYLTIALIRQTIGESPTSLDFELKIRETESLQWKNYYAKLDVCNDGKLLRYNQSGNGEQMGGYPQYLPYGLELSLDALFLHNTITSENEIFKDYKGNHHIVSSLTYEYTTLQWQKPINDTFLSHLNTILHCDEKYIDGERYELVDGNINVERIDRLNGRFLSVNIQRLEEQYTPSANTIIEYDQDGRNGTAVISASQPYTLAANGYTFTENADGTISFSTGKNLTNTAKTTTADIVSKIDGSVIGSVTLTNDAWSRGVGHYKIAQTFIVS